MRSFQKEHLGPAYLLDQFFQTQTWEISVVCRALPVSSLHRNNR